MSAAEQTNPTIKLADQPIIVDRSTLENYLDCPLSARLRESAVKSADLIASTGNEVHEAISEALKSYIDAFVGSDKLPRPSDIRESIERGTWHSRPDVQPDVIRATRYALHTIAKTIGEIQPDAILAFDGGDEHTIPEYVTAAIIEADIVANEFEVTVANSSEIAIGQYAFGFGIGAGAKVVKIDGETVTLSSPSHADRHGRIEFKRRRQRSLSGQMDADFQYGNRTIRVTAEVDLLHSTRSPGLLRLIDWKSGHLYFTESTVEDSFQFQCYSYLVMETFQDIDAVDAVVCNTRTASWTRPVRFERSDMERIRSRIIQAINGYMANRSAELSKVWARPSREACRLCSAAAMCHVVDQDIKDIKANPEKAVDDLFALVRSKEEREKTLKCVLNERRLSGDFRDIESPSGNRFGYKKPKQERASSPVLYGVKEED